MVTESEWESVADDPHPQRDLGYCGETWEVISVEQRGSEHCLFLPPEEECIWREEFVIAEAELVCDLTDAR